MSGRPTSDDQTAPGPAESRCPVRQFPLRRPKNHKPPIARYSAVLPQTDQVAVLFLGIQSQSPDALASAATDVLSHCVGAHAPASSDQAVFTDKQGYLNHVIALYWLDAREYQAWHETAAITGWREQISELSRIGLWWEPIVVDGERAETIAFKEFQRGFARCPACSLQPTEGSGYWGAARDRIPSSAYDLFLPALDSITHQPTEQEPYHAIQPPRNMTVIRSGVSWEKCEGEQLKDYNERIKPKLDDGMSYLRENPRETGCFTLRQVVSIGEDGKPLPEAYSLGAFVSLGHLESWAEHHPSHLAIYTRAMASRRKYQDALQLRTYNEIFILDDENPKFEYFNCHPLTGLLPYSDVVRTNARC